MFGDREYQMASKIANKLVPMRTSIRAEREYDVAFLEALIFIRESERIAKIDALNQEREGKALSPFLGQNLI